MRAGASRQSIRVPVRDDRYEALRAPRPKAESSRREGVIATMRMMLAASALLFDVGDFAVRGDLTVVTGHAPAAKCGEPEKTDQTHHMWLQTDAQQVLYLTIVRTGFPKTSRPVRKWPPAIFRNPSFGRLKFVYLELSRRKIESRIQIPKSLGQPEVVLVRPRWLSFPIICEQR